MAGKKSKTDVSARLGAKNLGKNCRLCGKAIDIVMSVTAKGKKSMRRICCGE
ncbi:MAG: hypothetical protein ISR96_06790 [Nitrospira sp.]|nr:hypothetical protein [bacterium]MBL7049202.1 hypothetical protein [Nitrospira sp.]